jgi:hypothetical protein
MVIGYVDKKSKSLKSLKSKSFLDEAFGFIDKFGAKPLIFNQNQNQSQSQSPSQKRC